MGLSELNAFLDQKSGSWKDDLLKSIADQSLNEWVQPTHCADANNEDAQFADYCEAVPFSLTAGSPFVYNTHGMLKDYVHNEREQDSFEQYLSRSAWVYAVGGHEIGINEMLGTEGNMDQRWYFAPNEAQYKSLYSESEKSNMDDFHSWLREELNYLAIVVKVPQFGAGKIKTFTSLCVGKVDFSDKVKIYANELMADGAMSDESIEMEEDSECVFSGLKENTKYVVSFVPLTLDGIGQFQVSFIAAY